MSFIPERICDADSPARVIAGGASSARRFVSLAVVLSVTALSTAGCVRRLVDPDVPGISRIDQMIADGAAESAAANRAVAEIETAVAAPRAPAPAQTFPSGVTPPPELAQLVSVDWDGPIEPLVRSLAARAGYSFAVKGPRPGATVTVTLHRREQPLWTIVRDAGVLVTNRAAVVLDLVSRQIEVRYAQ